jgi:hypothetical protein
MSLWKKCGYTLLVASIFVTLIVGVELAKAEDAKPVGGVIKTMKVEVTPEDFIKDFQGRVTEQGFLMGPFDITVHPSDKGANGFKHSNVPFITVTSGLVMFPSGDDGKSGKPVFIYATGVTIRTK